MLATTTIPSELTSQETIEQFLYPDSTQFWQKTLTSDRFGNGFLMISYRICIVSLFQLLTEVHNSTVVQTANDAWIIIIIK